MFLISVGPSLRARWVSGLCSRSHVVRRDAIGPAYRELDKRTEEDAVCCTEPPGRVSRR